MQITGTGLINPLTIDERGLGAVSGEWGDNRALSFSLNAGRAAMVEAGWEALAADDGFVLATTTGQYLMWERQFVELAEGRLSRSKFAGVFARQPLSDLAARIRSILGPAKGPTSVVTTACTASTQALSIARLWLQSGRCRRVLVGGVEVLCPLTVEGFRCLQLLSPSPARPFDLRRSGINLSEGAGFLCLERETARGFVRLSGFGLSSDAYHMTSPTPDGEGSRRAMQGALRMAGISPADVDWIHAHGTGSRHNDAAEASAILREFGDRVPVSSTKGRHGHALGASGLLESVLVVRAMREGKMLGTAGFEERDPEAAVNVVREDRRQPLRHVLKNTLGFGGANAALVFSC